MWFNVSGATFNETNIARYSYDEACIIQKSRKLHKTRTYTKKAITLLPSSSNNKVRLSKVIAVG